MPGPQPFETDIKNHLSYQYTKDNISSSHLANQRLTELTLKLIPKRSLEVLDIGCGDGTYTAILAQSRPTWKISGFDPAKLAIKAAQKKFPNLKFWTADLLTIKSSTKADMGIVRGVIHHLPKPALGIAQSAKLTKQLLIIEPNGYNPLLKVIEKVSPYHRQHHEQSFTTTQLESWLSLAGCQIKSVAYVGLVPFFCPQFLVGMLKWLEPKIERSWLAKYLCAQQVILTRPRS